MPDPLQCPRCGGPKVADDILCVECAKVIPSDAADVGIDDPPPNNIPDAFPRSHD